MNRIRVNKNNCSGCKLCVMNCSFWHFDVTAPHLSRIRIIGTEATATFKPTLCHQCIRRYCIESCPTHALSINEITGAIDVNRQLCTLCGECVEACIYDAIYISKDPEGQPILMVCDLCGGDPQCVKYCRLDAIAFK